MKKVKRNNKKDKRDKKSKRGSRAREECSEVDFLCLSGLNKLSYNGGLPILSRTGCFQGATLIYDCGHKMDRRMIIRCPDILREDCKALVVPLSREYTILRNFILFDPYCSVMEKLARVTDKCPACFFKPLLLKHPVCCSCGQPIAVGDAVYLHPFNEGAGKRLGVMHTKYAGKLWLVRCMRKDCGQARRRALLAWDGEKLLLYKECVKRLKQPRHAA